MCSKNKYSRHYWYFLIIDDEYFAGTVSSLSYSRRLLYVRRFVRLVEKYRNIINSVHWSAHNTWSFGKPFVGGYPRRRLSPFNCVRLFCASCAWCARLCRVIFALSKITHGFPIIRAPLPTIAKAHSIVTEMKRLSAFHVNKSYIVIEFIWLYHRRISLLLVRAAL